LADDVRAILLDIEGTTTPIAFVYDVLFPYARAHLREYLRDRPDPDAIDLLKQEWTEEPAASAAPAPPAATSPELARYVEWLMDCDRKSPGLKRLQGLVWERGYRDGVLKGDVFADVRPALERWHKRGIKVAIYSSGSALAQRLLFSTTAFGDLTTLLSGFFDTSSGVKTSPESYRRIAAVIGCSTAQLLFVSDVAAELDAARSAGCQALLCVRPGNAAQRVSANVPVVHTFDEIR
jgi:enolase-phosphatase E1